MYPVKKLAAFGLVNAHKVQRWNGIGFHPAGWVGSLNVFFEFGTELFDAVLQGPSSTVGEAADRRPRHDADGVPNFRQQIEILQASLAVRDAGEHARGPGGSFATRRALAAAFVREEPSAVHQEVHHLDGFIHDDNRCGAKAEATELARTGKIERAVEFIGLEQTHADAARNGSLRLAILPDAAAVFVDQLLASDAEGRFVAARLVDVS